MSAADNPPATLSSFWMLHIREKDGSCFISQGDYEAGRGQAFDVSCDEKTARLIVDSLNRAIATLNEAAARPAPATRGRMDQAKRFALMNFDKWNEVTGFVTPHSGYYYEITSLVEDGVEFGFGVVHGQRWKEILKRIRTKQR